MKKNVEIDKSLKDLNVPIIDWKNEIKTISTGLYEPKSTVIRFYAITDCVISDPKNDSIEINIPEKTIEYMSISEFKLKSGSANIVNL